jgi:hypothetical protein
MDTVPPGEPLDAPLQLRQVRPEHDVPLSRT